VAEDNNQQENPYFAPNVLKKVLIEDLMPLSPLWACCFGPIPQHASNAEVECHFSILKRNLPQNKRVNPASLVKNIYVNTCQEMTELVNKLTFNCV